MRPHILGMKQGRAVSLGNLLSSRLGSILGSGATWLSGPGYALDVEGGCKPTAQDSIKGILASSEGRTVYSLQSWEAERV